MKSSTFFRIAAYMLAFTLITSCFVGETFAKYVTSAAGTDSARIAKWSFNVSGNDIATKSFTFDLFNTTVRDLKDYQPETEVVASTENNVIIAPGTYGTYDIVIKNTSEVTAEYTVKFEETAFPDSPILYRGDGVQDSYIDDITKLNTSGTLAPGASRTYTVRWAWYFGTDDTALGIASREGTAINPEVKATITAKQVD